MTPSFTDYSKKLAYSLCVSYWDCHAQV